MMTSESMLGWENRFRRAATACHRRGVPLAVRLWTNMAAVTAILVLGATVAVAAEPPPRKVLPTPRPEPAAKPGEFPPPAPAKDPSRLGLGVQRTMTLLATSTPQHRNHVRVLFYGQSITEQEWSKQVAADLRKRASPTPTWRSRTGPSAASPPNC